jgi:hypothetical protein
MELLIDQHFKAIDFIDIVSFFWFIQNHRQGRTGSATGLEKYPDGADLIFLEIILENVFGLFRHVNH